MNLEIKERNEYKKILKNYNIIKATISEIDLEIEYLKNNNELSQDKEKILIINKKRNEKLINKINNRLNNLSLKEKQLVQLRYLSKEPFTWYQIGNILQLSEGYCRTKLNDKCLYKLFKIENN